MTSKTNQNSIISIITVNYNGCKDTCDLLRSLRENITTPYEVIVVDNASNGDDVEYINREFPDITVIRSEKNLGFAGGNNLGIAEAQGKYIMLLNNDTEMDDDSLRYLIDRIESSPEIGVVSPKIKFYFEPRHIQYAGMTPMSGITLRNESVGFDQPDSPQYNTACPTGFAHGAAMMIKREAIEKAGMMPEMFFLYYEELDWCQRIENVGYTIWYEPLTTVYHKESRSTGRQSPMKIKYITRNRLLYGWRNLTGTDRYVSILYQLVVALPKNFLLFLFKGKLSLASASLKGCGEFFFMRNKMSGVQQ